MENRKDRHGPCLEKNCGWCCDPVKLPSRFPQELIPKNEHGDPIWTKTGEHLLPEGAVSSREMLEAYECAHYDHDAKTCKVYENRPEICRRTSCLDPQSQKSVDEQHREVTEQRFTSLGKK